MKQKYINFISLKCSFCILFALQELMDSVSELQPKAFRDVLAEQDKQTQPVYSWLCNSDYSHYLNRIFKDMCNESDEE